MSSSVAGVAGVAAHANPRSQAASLLGLPDELDRGRRP